MRLRAPARKQFDPKSAALRRFGLSITALTVLGHTVLGFEQAYRTPLVAALAAVGTELLLESVEALAGGRRPRYRCPPGQALDFLLPAYIAGLACAMLLYGNGRALPIVFAAVVAVASKYIVRLPIGGRSRHVLNPSNAGIVVVLLMFPWVGIAPPYQFTEWFSGWLDAAVPLLLLAAGTMDAQRRADRQDAADPRLGGRFPGSGRDPGSAHRGVADQRAAPGHRGGVPAVHQLHDHRSGDETVRASRAGRVRGRHGGRLRGPGAAAHRFRAFFRTGDHLCAACRVPGRR